MLVDATDEMMVKVPCLPSVASCWSGFAGTQSATAVRPSINAAAVLAAPASKPAAAAPAAPSQAQAAANFPPALKSYIFRALKTCTADQEKKTRVEAELRNILNEADRCALDLCKPVHEHDCITCLCQRQPGSPYGLSFTLDQNTLHDLMMGAYC